MKSFVIPCLLLLSACANEPEPVERDALATLAEIEAIKADLDKVSNASPDAQLGAASKAMGKLAEIEAKR